MASLPCYATGSPRPNHASSPKEAAEVRKVEVTILGQIRDLKGVQWAEEPHRGHALSTSVGEDCDVTIHLPSGKNLSLRTRPILFFSRAFDDDTVLSVSIPPAGTRGTLSEKAHEIERLLVAWDIKPGARLRADLEEWKKPVRLPVITFVPSTKPNGADPVTRPALSSTRPTLDPVLAALGKQVDRALTEEPDIGTRMRTGTSLDERTEITFEVDGNDRSGWYLIAEVGAKQAEWERLMREARERRDAATRPTRSPSLEVGPHN